MWFQEAIHIYLFFSTVLRFQVFLSNNKKMFIIEFRSFLAIICFHVTNNPLQTVISLNNYS